MTNRRDQSPPNFIFTRTMFQMNTWKRKDLLMVTNIISVFSIALFTEQVENTTLSMIISFLLTPNFSKVKCKKSSIWKKPLNNGSKDVVRMLLSSSSTEDYNFKRISQKESYWHLIKKWRSFLPLMGSEWSWNSFCKMKSNKQKPISAKSDTILTLKLNLKDTKKDTATSEEALRIPMLSKDSTTWT